ncbi:hypothetical protein B0O99DRAFT_692327 [Bisporella sp. PMI_857]|nr:hypothetical protein B0O99DRAFT_692327 [Bisporella sp. PMI_857]
MRTPTAGTLNLVVESASATAILQLLYDANVPAAAAEAVGAAAAHPNTPGFRCDRAVQALTTCAVPVGIARKYTGGVAEAENDGSGDKDVPKEHFGNMLEVLNPDFRLAGVWKLGIFGRDVNGVR